MRGGFQRKPMKKVVPTDKKETSIQETVRKDDDVEVLAIFPKVETIEGLKDKQENNIHNSATLQKKGKLEKVKERPTDNSDIDAHKYSDTDSNSDVEIISENFSKKQPFKSKTNRHNLQQEKKQVIKEKVGKKFCSENLKQQNFDDQKDVPKELEVIKDK